MTEPILQDSSKPSGRILIVDDDRDLAESLADILTARHYEVEVANSLAQAEKRCQQFEVQVALLDIRLGGESGLDVIGLLKRLHPKAICVMVTGFAETDTAIEALRQGAYDYLAKPLKPSHLFPVLDRCFDKIRLEAEAAAAYEAMCEAKERAEAAAKAKTEFLAAMGHELRTPLHSIIGFSEVLQTEAFGKLGDEKYLDYAGDIRNSGSHLLAIINDILDMAKAEAGKLELRESEAQISDIVALALRLMKPLAQDKDIQIKSEIEPDLPNFRGDEQKVRQVLINLLSNAIKFTPKEGRVTLSVSLAEDGGILMAVADTGIGIAPEDVPKALEPFSQVDSKLNRAHEGTGLGLSLSVAMVELHGGTLELESQPDHGTTVTLRLPAWRSQPKTCAA